MSILNENALVDKVAKDYNIKDKKLVQDLWQKAIIKQTNEGTITSKSNRIFWKGDRAKNKGVVNYFKELTNNLNVEEAKLIMDNRNQFQQSVNGFIDALASDDYTKAQTEFPNVVRSKLMNMINNRKEVYLKQLQKQANDIAKE
jgi:Mg/Co/Ni transporter MgtE